jgi:hypothetical protein
MWRRRLYAAASEGLTLAAGSGRTSPAVRSARFGSQRAAPPRGYAADHPALEDLRRKDFIALASLSVDDVTSPRLLELTGSRFASAAPLMRFLCEALRVPY